MKHPSKILSLVLVLSLLMISTTGCSGNLIDTILADLPIATDIATSVVAIVAPGNAGYLKEVTEYAGKVTADLKLLKSLVSQYKSNLAGAPGDVLAKCNAALNDAQGNLAQILKAVGVGDPKVTAAVTAAVDSVKLILNDVGLLIKNNAPPAVSAQVFFGVGMPGVDFMAMVHDKTAVAPPVSSPHKSARQLAKEYNAKISKDFPKAKVHVPKGIVHKLTLGVVR